MDRKEVEKQFQEAKRHFGDRYRLVVIDNKYIIQSYFKIGKYWQNTKRIYDEPVFGFWSFLGIGDIEFNNQELYAKKCFIDFVASKTKKSDFKVI